MAKKYNEVTDSMRKARRKKNGSTKIRLVKGEKVSYKDKDNTLSYFITAILIAIFAAFQIQKSMMIGALLFACSIAFVAIAAYETYKKKKQSK
ncbi:MAG: hypothetical protein RR646_02670 [Erysipelotrichaceae bacterium]